METYVPATEQLVTEIIVQDISRSVYFYVSLGFHSFRKEGDFAELLWEGIVSSSLSVPRFRTSAYRLGRSAPVPVGQHPRDGAQCRYLGAGDGDRR